MAYDIYASPVGDLHLRVESGRLVALQFQAPPRLVLEEPADLLKRNNTANQAVMDQAREQLDAYFARQRQAFDLPIALKGTPFQLRVWAELRGIAYGTTISYRELARRVGQEGAARAVGSANAVNPIAILIPCHRVIASDGTLGGFAGGVSVKSKLLDLERSGAGQFALTCG